MAHLGIFVAGQPGAPETGSYQHSACGDTKTIKKKQIIQFCGSEKTHNRDLGGQ